MLQAMLESTMREVVAVVTVEDGSCNQMTVELRPWMQGELQLADCGAAIVDGRSYNERQWSYDLFSGEVLSVDREAVTVDAGSCNQLTVKLCAGGGCCGRRTTMAGDASLAARTGYTRGGFLFFCSRGECAWGKEQPRVRARERDTELATVGPIGRLGR